MAKHDILVVESDEMALAKVHNALTDLGYMRVEGVKDGRYGVYRRGEKCSADHKGGIVLDSVNRSVTWKGGYCVLTEQQFSVLKLLASHPRKITPHAMLLECVLGYTTPPESNVVASCISTLRARLSPIGLYDLVENIHSVGYRINPTYISTLTLT